MNADPDSDTSVLYAQRAEELYNLLNVKGDPHWRIGRLILGGEARWLVARTCM